MTAALVLVLAAFLACAVEAVEALTIVLAIGLTRGWRSTMTGVTSAVGVLAVIVAALGPALTLVPITALRLVVGALLLVFGLQWLRKAILRAAGVKATHDEAVIYQRQVADAEVASQPDGGIDWYAFTVAFKGVLLEGLEVAFIVLTFGANQGSIGFAAAGAVAAVVVVVTVGCAVRGPLARVPENTLKYMVGLMLTTFGTFWAAEGAGAHWPGGDAALPAILTLVTGVALVLTRRLYAAHGATQADASRADVAGMIR